VASSVAVAISPCPAGPRGAGLTVATRRVAVNTVVVGFVLPLRIVAWAARALGAHRSATRLRALTAGVPIAAYLVTGVAWFFLQHRGIFYPVSDAGGPPGLMRSAHRRRSVGGPSCLCPWAAVGRCVSLRPLESRKATPFTHTTRRRISHIPSRPALLDLEAWERSCIERRKKR
jgi:hypothetical protein